MGSRQSLVSLRCQVVLGIAEHGYHWGKLGAANTNFMPLYPALIRAVAPLMGGSAWLASWVVANLASLVATCLFWLWVERCWGRDVAFRATLLLTAFPFAFFYGAPYAEPLFVALAVGALLLAERGRSPGAAMCAGLCTITRPVGLALVIALVILAIHRRDCRAIAISCASSLPLVAFAGFLAVAFGHPLGS